MIRRTGALVIIVAAMAGAGRAADRHQMSGLVVEVDAASRTVVVSHQAVPRVMPAMTMSFAVRRTALLEGLKPGAMIEFTLVVDGEASYIDSIRVRGYESLEQKPFELRRLTELNRLVNPESASVAVAVHPPVPDFSLTNQAGSPVSLAALKGRIVVVTFGYLRCSNPAYCFRLASNLGHLQKRFANTLGRDIVLLTIVLDPEHDREGALSDYARVWTSRPETWHFLTGPLPEVTRVAGLFGVEFWKDEGSVVHTLKTAVIDRDGRLAAAIDGNQFTVQQLDDLVAGMLNRSPKR